VGQLKIPFLEMPEKATDQRGYKHYKMGALQRHDNVGGSSSPNYDLTEMGADLDCRPNSQCLKKVALLSVRFFRSTSVLR